jgi:hypothetical protein
MLCPYESVSAVMGDLQSHMVGVGRHGFGRARFNMYFDSYLPVVYETKKKLSEAYSKHEVVIE